MHNNEVLWRTRTIGLRAQGAVLLDPRLPCRACLMGHTIVLTDVSELSPCKQMGCQLSKGHVCSR